MRPIFHPGRHWGEGRERGMERGQERQEGGDYTTYKRSSTTTNQECKTVKHSHSLISGAISNKYWEKHRTLIAGVIIICTTVLA